MFSVMVIRLAVYSYTASERVRLEGHNWGEPERAPH